MAGSTGLSDEDLEVKQKIELYVERAQDHDPQLQKFALESMRQEIQSSISSMTSVRKPLKFLRPHYGTLKAYFKTMPESESKKYMADILSVLALTMAAEGERESLQYKLLGSEGDINSWGHEYVRNLDGEIALECKERRQKDTNASMDDIMELVKQIVAFYMKHNAEPEAVDLLTEVNELYLLHAHLDKTNFKRTCLYLTSLARYLLERDKVLDKVCWIYLQHEEYPSALQIALSLDDMQLVRRAFTFCNDVLQKKQCCFILARHGITFVLGEEMVPNEEDREMLQDIINNSRLSEGYLTLARDIEVMDPKSPKDIYKEDLLDVRTRFGAIVDSARQNLAATFVSAFVNAGFGQDKLMTVTSGSSGNWIYKNREHGKISAAASLGVILLWDVDSGLTKFNKYYDVDELEDNHVCAGALLGIGILNCSVKDECDPAMALLLKYAQKEEENASIKIGAIMGLGIAYAGSRNETLREKLVDNLCDAKASLDVIIFTAISLGLIYVGSCDAKVAQDIITAMMDRNELEFEEEVPLTLLPLGLSLLYLGKKEKVDETKNISASFVRKIRKYSDVTLVSCAYAGTGDVLKVQDLMEHVQSGELHQGFAVLGIAMVAMAEEIGVEMEIRALERILQYGEKNTRRAVPLALGLLCISNPKVDVTHTLSRLTHNTDSEVAMAAIISLGLIGAGTNNARIADKLRNLSIYYYRDTDLLCCVRLAQGLLHLGKGLLTLNPYHSDGFLLSPTALAGLIIVLHACLDMNTIVLGKYHYVLYFLVLAMQPRMLLTVDEDLKPLSVPVRVGKAVDVVGQAGQPRTITGFQTLPTPVLLGAGERAELATEKYIPLSPFLEGFVILKENPDYEDEKGGLE